MARLSGRSKKPPHDTGERRLIERVFFLIAITAAAPTTRDANAQDSLPTTIRIGDLSLSLGGYGGHAGVAIGAVFPQNVTWDGQGHLNGIPLNAAGKLSLNPGVTEVLIADYALSKYVNAEIQLGHSSLTFKNFRGSVQVAGLGPEQATASVSGSIGGLSGLFNLVISPLGPDSTVAPLLGVGVGAAGSRAKLNALSGFGLALPINQQSSATDLATDLFASVEVRVTKRLLVGVAYQFIRVNGDDIGTGGAFIAKNGPLLQHSLVVVAEYNF